MVAVIFFLNWVKKDINKNYWGLKMFYNWNFLSLYKDTLSHMRYFILSSRILECHVEYFISINHTKSVLLTEENEHVDFQNFKRLTIAPFIIYTIYNNSTSCYEWKRSWDNFNDSIKCWVFKKNMKKVKRK